MRYNYQKVEIPKINLADASFQISDGEASAKLISSIASLGLLNPPTLIAKSNSYCIVCGFARVFACQKLGFKAIRARVIAPDTPIKKCVQLAVADKAFLQDLNPVEQARSLQLLEQVCDSPEELLSTSQHIGMALNPKIVNKLLLINQMPSCLRRGLSTGAIALPVALQLKRIKEKDVLDSLCDLFIDLDLSLNRQRVLLDSMIAISKREQIKIEQLLAEAPLEKIRRNQELDRRQRATQIQLYLKKRRWPAISSFEMNYSALVKQLQLKKGTRIVAPANFEGSTYSIQFDFQNVKEMKKMEMEVRRIVQSPHMEHILDQLKPKT